MPRELKRRLADEVKQSGRSVNDVAVGHLAASLAVHFEPSGRAGSSPREGGSVLLRMPPELKERLVRRAAERRQTVNELIVGTLSERLGTNGKEAMASNNGSSNGKTPGKDKEPNWLPAPKGPFIAFMRLYWPKEAALDGAWKHPPMTKV